MNMAAGGPGPLTVEVTAPATPGVYRLFARLLPVTTDSDALAQYESGFASALATNYVEIGTLSVT